MPAEPCEPTIAICPARLVSVRPYLKHLSLSTVARRPGLGGMARRHLPDVRFRDGGAGGHGRSSAQDRPERRTGRLTLRGAVDARECVQNADVHPAHSDDRAEQSEVPPPSFIQEIQRDLSCSGYECKAHRAAGLLAAAGRRFRPATVPGEAARDASETRLKWRTARPQFLPASAELGTTPCGPWRRLFD